MERNVGPADRSVRVVLGAILAAAGLAGFLGLWAANTAVATVLVVVGIVFLGTGLAGQCLLYRPFGIDTNR